MRSASGYSLLELLVVLAIMGLIATVAVPMAATSVERMTLSADARSLVTQLRDLRDSALDQQRQMVVTAQGAQSGSLTVSAGTTIEVGAEGFSISADGIPSGRLRLSRSGSAVHIVTHQLTGRIAVAAAP